MVLDHPLSIQSLLTPILFQSKKKNLLRVCLEKLQYYQLGVKLVADRSCANNASCFEVGSLYNQYMGKFNIIFLLFQRCIRNDLVLDT